MQPLKEVDQQGKPSLCQPHKKGANENHLPELIQVTPRLEFDNEPYLINESAKFQVSPLNFSSKLWFQRV